MHMVNIRASSLKDELLRTMLQYFPQEGIFIHSFIHSEDIHVVPSTGRGFVVDTIKDKNESDVSYS